MRIGSLGFSPFIYNTNMLSASSLSKVSPIGDDLTMAKTDYSALTDASLNVNPLGKGESVSFFDILGMQMQMSRMNASRVLSSEEMPVVAPDAEMTQSVEERPEVDMAPAEQMEIQETVSPEELVSDVVSLADTAMDAAEAVQDFKPVNQMEEILTTHFDRNLYQMQRASEAYRVQML